MIRVFGIRNCDTMKKAFAWLAANEVVYEFVDYRQAGVAQANLPNWNRQLGWQALLNTRGTSWRKLSAAERADVGEQKALELMAQHPTLIKRPLLDSGDRLLVGFAADDYATLLP